MRLFQHRSKEKDGQGTDHTCAFLIDPMILKRQNRVCLLLTYMNGSELSETLRSLCVKPMHEVKTACPEYKTEDAKPGCRADRIVKQKSACGQSCTDDPCAEKDDHHRRSLLDYRQLADPAEICHAHTQKQPGHRGKKCEDKHKEHG